MATLLIFWPKTVLDRRLCIVVGCVVIGGRLQGALLPGNPWAEIYLDKSSGGEGLATDLVPLLAYGHPTNECDTSL